MTRKLPINAKSPGDARRIASDMARDLPAGIVVDSITYIGEEPLRPFANVAASQTGAHTCYLFAIEFHRVR